MDDLKTLIEAVAKLPQMAIWVVVMFWAYKVVVIGSLYGLIRFVVMKAHDYLVREKTEQVRYKIDDLVLDVHGDRVIDQLRRVIESASAGAGLRSFHHSHLEWLRAAISEKIQNDKVRAEMKTSASMARKEMGAAAFSVGVAVPP